MQMRKQVRTFHVPAIMAGRITPGKRYDLLGNGLDRPYYIHDDKAFPISIAFGGCGYLDGRKWDVIHVHPFSNEWGYIIGGVIGLVAMIVIGLWLGLP